MANEPNDRLSQTDPNLDSYVQALKQLQQANPQIVGVSLFGSRLKKENDLNASIDCTIFINADILASDGVAIVIDQTNKPQWGEYEALKDDMRDNFGDFLAKKVSKDPYEVKRGIYIEPLSQSIVVAQIDQFFSYLTLHDKYEEAAQAWVEGSYSDNAWTPQEEVPPKPQAPQPVNLVYVVPAIFALDLIGGLESYREFIINKLLQSKANGERSWQSILTALKFGSDLARVDVSQYPTSLSLAQQLYLK